MRSFRLLVITTLIVLLSVNVLAQQTSELSVAQLKEQIQLLLKIDRDENTSTEVRKLNSIFLKQRRMQLEVLLTKNLEKLRSYLSTIAPSLTSEEKLIVQNTIDTLEKDLKSLTEDTAVRSSNDVQTSSSAVVNPSLPMGSDSAVPSTEVVSGNGNGNGNGNGSASSGVVSTPIASTPLTAAASTTQTTFGPSLNIDLNTRIRSKVRVDQTDNTKQTDAPSLSGSSATLVDQSSASDLMGLAANLAGLSASSNDNQQDPSSVSVTANAYSLLAAINRVDPLNPVFYDQHRNWRKLSFTLGYDDEDLPDGTRQRAKLFGAKFMFLNRRDPSRGNNSGYIDTITSRLKTATGAFGDLSDRVRRHFFSLDAVRTNLLVPGFKAYLDKKKPEVELELERERSKLATASESAAPPIKKKMAELEEQLQRIERMRKNPGHPDLFVLGSTARPTPTWSLEESEYQAQFLTEYLGPDYRTKVGEEIAKALDLFIDQQLTDAELVAFRNLDDAAREAVESIRRAPQLAVGFTAKQRRIGIDEYLGSLIFDYGVADRINLTLNGSYTYNDSEIVGGDLRGFKFAGQLKFQLNRENLLGKKPLFFDISTSGSWMNNVDALYKAQGKLTIPIADGIEFPVSVTWANRTSLIDEKEVRGQFGFTLDTARLMRMFVFR